MARRLLVRIALVLDALVCGVWAYSAATAMLRQLSGTGSGGIAGVSSGLPEMLYTVVPPIVTMVLARAAGSRLATYWRNAHLAALLALIVLPMMSGLRVIMVSIAILLPVQLFFVIGGLAIWFDKADNPPLRPGTSPEASS